MTDKKLGRIYKITCSETKKLYIGITTNTINHRWNKHVSDAKKFLKCNYEQEKSNKRGFCTKLCEDINKYGANKFAIELIEECDISDLDNKEIAYIKQFNSLYPNGYNLSNGGKHFMHNEETKKIIKEKTKQGIKKKIDNYRTHEQSKGLPVYIIYTKIKGREAYAINGHPLCDRKSFTTLNCSLEEAKKQALNFLEELEKKNEKYIPNKIDIDLPKGLRKIKNGYRVQKINKGTLHYKVFTNKSDEENKKDAINYLNELINYWNQ